MRWKYADLRNPIEAAEVQRVYRAIDQWWDAFQAKTDDLQDLFSQKKRWDLPAWMEQHLSPIDSRLMWEYGPAVCAQGHRLVITPEAHICLRPLVRTILERAPLINGWEFYEYRLAENLDEAIITVKARTGFDISAYMVKVSLNDRHRINLTFTSPSIDEAHDEAAMHASFVACETLLGEECLDHWIGAIEVIPLPRTKRKKVFNDGPEKSPMGFISLDRLANTVASLIDSTCDQLPENPHYEWVESAQWGVWKLTPQEADDYVSKHDLFVGVSANSEMWTAAHSNDLFSSNQFSRCHETFCYVKIDGTQGEMKGFADRGEIEDAINEILVPNQLGCRIGGGTGLRYSYVDLAITDLDKAIPLIRQRLQEGGVPKRTWIQFFDGHLSEEWIGIHDDSPPPPMPDDRDL